MCFTEVEEARAALSAERAAGREKASDLAVRTLTGCRSIDQKQEHEHAHKQEENMMMSTNGLHY